MEEEDFDKWLNGTIAKYVFDDGNVSTAGIKNEIITMMKKHNFYLSFFDSDDEAEPEDS